MKNLLVLSLSICSLCFFSCNNSIEDAGSFYIGTNVNGDEVSISWINKAICGDQNIFEGTYIKDKNYSDINYDLLYSTEYYQPPKTKIKVLRIDKEYKVTKKIENIKSPYVVKGLEKGKTYYMKIVPSLDYINSSEVFEVHIP